MKRCDITDEQIVQACVDAHASFVAAAGELLMERAGAPWKVVEAAMRRAEDRGLIDYGTSIWTAWSTEEGRRLLREAE